MRKFTLFLTLIALASCQIKKLKLYLNLWRRFLRLGTGKEDTLFPDIGFGYVIVKLKSDERKFGSQDGTEFRLGTTANYYVSKSASFFLGVRFIHTSLEVNTNNAYENYFGQANQVQFSAGIKFD
jgi:hypothetical protein